MNRQPPSTLRQLAQADLLLLLASAFAPGSGDRRPRVAASSADLDELCERSGLSDYGVEEQGLSRWVEQARSMDGQTWTVEHTRLFESALAAPPNETAYIRRDKGAILADISGFYKAFGFDLADGIGEKADHIAVELNFAALLLVLLARARDRDDMEAAAVTHEALSAFADDHLGAWIDIFCDRLAQVAGLPGYSKLAELLRASWNTIVTDNALPRPAGLADPPDPDPGTPYECGMCSGPPAEAPG